MVSPPFPFSFYNKVYLPFLFHLGIEIHTFFLFNSMVRSSEVRQLCPSISFLFVRLGVSLGSFHTHCPPIKGFVFRGNGLGLVLANLFPLLR